MKNYFLYSISFLQNEEYLQPLSFLLSSYEIYRYRWFYYYLLFLYDTEIEKCLTDLLEMIISGGNIQFKTTS